MLLSARQMLAKRQAMGDQTPAAAAAKRKRAADSDDEDDDSDGGGGGRQRSEAENRRAKAREGGSKTAAVKPSKQVQAPMPLTPSPQLLQCISKCGWRCLQRFPCYCSRK
jgi:hypothetical protein